MNEQTNLIWKGELVLWNLALTIFLSPFFIFPIYFLFFVGESYSDLWAMLCAGCLFALIGYPLLRWRWRGKEDEAAWLLAHPPRWLLHWHYDPVAWRTYTRAIGRACLIYTVAYILFMFVIVSIAFFLSGAGEMIRLDGVFGIITLGLTLYALIFYLTLPYLRLINTAPELFVTRSELWIGGVCRYINCTESRLVQLQLIEGQPSQLEFTISTGNGNPRGEFCILLPVPVDQTDAAHQVIEQLTGQIAQQPSG